MGKKVLLLLCGLLLVTGACSLSLSGLPLASGGSRIVIVRGPDQRVPNPEFELWLASLREGGMLPELVLEKEILRGNYLMQHVRISPDGRQVLFETLPSEEERQLDIFVMRIDGTGLRNLTENPAYDGQAVWSPDGRKIVFRSNRDGKYRLYRMDLRRGTVEKLFADDTVCASGFPSAWLPGEELAFSGCGRKLGTCELYVTPLERCEPRRLTENLFDEVREEWTRDGRYAASVIAYMKPAPPPTKGQVPSSFSWLYLVDRETGEARIVYEHPSSGWSIADLAWEPTGERLLLLEEAWTVPGGLLSGNEILYLSTLYLLSLPSGKIQRVITPEGGVFEELDWGRVPAFP